ncbi:molybdopterin-guanine dinucleotide biosynthesis protein B [Ornithinibacillus salinisoli]|uniref:Molybdopterin-guanine dinucleotide biosynthesis protein B n=2 Tax=Ornithinibacillus salinisoli TaxID=1848459 RepID=A0ABW4W826_9BACI
MNVLQIVGYKKSGKTTLSTRIIDFMTEKDIRVGSLKHHGHGGLPLGLENTDSEKQLQAGAVVAGVEGEGLFQFSVRDEWQINQIIAIYKLLEVQYLVIEGYKNLAFPKIVLIKQQEDLRLLQLVTNIVAVVSDLPIEDNSYPVFRYSDFNDLVHWIYQDFPLN